MNYPVNHYPPERPCVFNTNEILRSINNPVPHPRRRPVVDLAKSLVAGVSILVLTWYLYWPIARGLAWGTLWLARLTGHLDAALPPYTPYPHEF